MALTHEDVRRRIAYSSVTASAPRNQGKGGIVKEAREFLAEMALEPFAQASDENSFRAELDRQTELLRPKALSWGAARKVLNIVLCEAFYNRVLYSHYKLERVGPFLEVALDSLVGGRLWHDAQKRGESLPPWDAIKRLTPDASRQYQDFAFRFAPICDLRLRVELEILYWSRGE